DVSGVSLGDAEGFGAVGGAEHLIAGAAQDPLGHLAQRVLVLDEQDGGAAAVEVHGVDRLAGVGGRRVGGGQQDGDGGATAGFGVDLYGAARLRDDPV